MSDSRYDLARVLAAHEQVLHALAFYADPENYHAILIVPDRPAGAFADDFDDEHGHPEYDRPMHGSQARAALGAWLDATEIGKRSSDGCPHHPEGCEADPREGQDFDWREPDIGRQP